MSLAASADLSAMLGWVSIACWVVVYSPQIYENYSLQSGEGLSVLFVLIWLLGDIFNFVGAILAKLLPTVIIIAAYYTLCDLTLMAQIYYYRWKARRPKHRVPEGEDAPLLQLDPTTAPPLSDTMLALRYVAALIFVFGTGIVAWWLTRGAETTEPPPPSSPMLQWIIQVLGWSSAVLYLGSRIPQILKNFETRCEGLAPALFFFAITGNLTYSGSILAKSLERDYLITNASWLAGSALTVFFDFFVLGQMWYYRTHPRE